MSSIDTSKFDTRKETRSPMMPSCVLLLNGFPGVGKLTIAKSISQNLSRSHTSFRLIDNHVLIDPAIAIEPIRNKAHYALRKAFRRTAFEGLKALEDRELVIIFTSCLATSAQLTAYDDKEQFGEYVGLAKARGVPLVLVNIVCDSEVNKERLRSEDRRQEGGKTKLVDVEILDKIRQETSLVDLKTALLIGKDVDLWHFELDTSDLNAEQATQGIHDYLGLRSQYRIYSKGSNGKAS